MSRKNTGSTNRIKIFINYPNNKAVKLKLVLAALLTSALAFLIIKTIAAPGPVVLYTSPAGSQTVVQDTIFPVSVRLQSAADVSITGASVYMSYPADKMQVESVNYEGSPYNLAIYESNANGILRIDRAALPKVPGGDNLFATVQFKALAPGSAPISYTASSYVTSGDEDVDLPVTRQGVTYTISPPPDITAPAVSISTPANNATVSGTVAVAANATDSVGVAGVRFRVDGVDVGQEDTAAPYSYNLDTLALANGNHILTAVARDEAGNKATSAAVTINVQNADVTMPTIAITSPANNSTVFGTVNVTATANDNVGVTGVQFKLNGANLGSEDTTAPYSISWNTTTVNNGNYSITAVAKDAANNSVTSTTTTVNVQNPDTTAPVVSITSPASNATVSGTISVVATATDNVGVVGVQFKMDGVNIGAEDTSSPYGISINTTNLTNGSHILAAIARDAAGNTTSSSNIVLNIQNADTTAPSVAISSPANNDTVSGTINIVANASDNVGVTGVQFKLNGANIGSEDTSSPYNFSINTLTLPNGNHSLSAVARDAAGNTSTAASITINVQNIDTIAPNPPASLNGTTTQPTTTTPGKVELSWPAATDNGSPSSGIKGYYVYRGSTIISPLISETSYTDDNVPAGSYSYTVRAVDNVNLTSTTASPAFSTTIIVPVDAQAPPAPTNLTATAPSTTQVNLSWAASSDISTGNSGIKGYNIYRGTSPNTITQKLNFSTAQNPSGLVATSSFGDVTVQHSTTYYYRVQAVDGADNLSDMSSSASVYVPALGDVTGITGTPDGKIDLRDVSYGIRAYGTTDPRADFTGERGVPDGIVDLYDISFLVQNYTP